MNQSITAINAKPETIQRFLTNSYVIPDYQRPYSWDEEQCSKLWEDITEFFDNINEEDTPYFLGNVVVYNENKKRYVIDGQQRLITLNLLVKALLDNNVAYSILEKCLYQHDPLTEEIQHPKQIRIEHLVLGDSENSKLEDVFHIEHILPKKWERYNYPDWNDGTYKNNHERLGNLVVLEGEKNIKVGNKPFADKKIEYQKSSLTEPREIANTYFNWSRNDFRQRNSEILDRLEHWFLEKN